MNLDISLLSTFDRFHDGGDCTFVGPLGAGRIDFVGVQCDLLDGVSKSYVCAGIDKLSSTPDDHDAVIVEIVLTKAYEMCKANFKFDRNKLKDSEAKDEFR